MRHKCGHLHVYVVYCAKPSTPVHNAEEAYIDLLIQVHVHVHVHACLGSATNLLEVVTTIAKLPVASKVLCHLAPKFILICLAPRLRLWDSVCS